MAYTCILYDDVKDAELHAAVLKATAPKEDKPHKQPPDPSEPNLSPLPVKFIALKQIAVGNADGADYGLFGIDYLGRLWRLIGDTWVFGGAPRPSDIPPGW